MTNEGAVTWMAKHGHPSYQTEIIDLISTKNEIIGDAGRYWQHCEITMETIRKIDAEIEAVMQEAYDRYDDWASDPL